MQLGMIGLGRMGGNIVRRLMRHGHKCVVYDTNAASVAQLASEGATPSQDLASFVKQLQAPRAVWVMLPAGPITEATVNALSEVLESGDIIIDGGNSNYQDDVRRAQALKGKGIRYIDVGTSGGVWGRRARWRRRAPCGRSRKWCVCSRRTQASTSRAHRADGGPTSRRLRPARAIS